MVQVALGMIAFVWLGMLPLQSWAQEPQTEENPVCPERPFYHPTDREVAETGLSPEVLCVIGDTWLMRHDIPGPEESPELLRRFLRLGPYEFGKMSGAQYRAVMEEAVRLWPKSYYAHAGLARALLGGHTAPDVQPTPTELRWAADEFQIAAEIAFWKGKIPDHIGNGLVQSLTELGDKQALDNYFKRVFELIPEGAGRYFSYLDYALVLAKLGDERAETYFQKAIAVRPELGSAYESYLGYLLDHGKAQAALDLLTSDSKARRVLPDDLFRHMRCQALKQLGRETECLQAGGPAPPGTPAPAGSGSGPSASVAPSERRLLARMLGSGLAYAAHDPNLLDDCRMHTSCEAHPKDPTGTCYHYFVWNLAEIIHNEARAEQFGSRAPVGWTIRDRVIRMSTPDCNQSLQSWGADGCTSSCPDPTSPFCDLQKKYCCVIHAPSQFVDTHPTAGLASIDVENLRLAANIIDSFTPEPTANFTPSGASVCTTNICDKSLHCLVHGDFSQYASEGPIYFYNNKDFLLTCQGFQPGVEHQCNVVAKETCGDTPDGGPPRFKDDADNCYGRATRNRPWNAGPNFTGSSGVTTSGNAKMIPAGAFIYKNDVFKNPGGKEFVVEALIIAIRCDPGVCQNTANLRVQLQNSVGVVIYDFGTITITASGSYSDYIFSSAIVVTAAGSQVRLINEGPREVTIQKVVARD